MALLCSAIFPQFGYFSELQLQVLGSVGFVDENPAAAGKIISYIYQTLQAGSPILVLHGYTIHGHIQD